MAQRFGGQYSPDPGTPQSSPLAKKKPGRKRSRANLLFVAALPILFTAFGGGAIGMVTSIGAFAVFMLAAWLTREGLEAHDAYDSRAVAKRPAIPRKLFGAALIGIGVGLVTFDTGIVDGVLYGIVASVLHIVAFGPDPLRDKGIEGVDSFQTDRVARAVDEAEKHLTAMGEAIAQTRDRVLIARVDRFQDSARDMFRSVEKDPRDLSAARKYLSVYLLGARDATVKFADLAGSQSYEAAKSDYTALLDDLEVQFSAKTQLLLEGNRTDLDIEIDVLRDRLRREGVRVTQSEN